MACKNMPHVVDLCRLTFGRKEAHGREKPLLTQPLFWRSFRRLISPLHPVFEACRQAVLHLPLVWYRLYITTET